MMARSFNEMYDDVLRILKEIDCGYEWYGEGYEKIILRDHTTNAQSQILLVREVAELLDFLMKAGRLVTEPTQEERISKLEERVKALERRLKIIEATPETAIVTDDSQTDETFAELAFNTVDMHTLKELCRRAEEIGCSLYYKDGFIWYRRNNVLGGTSTARRPNREHKGDTFRFRTRRSNLFRSLEEFIANDEKLFQDYYNPQN